MPTYNRLPVSFTHGSGVWLWDLLGRRYIDAVAGLAVNVLGHAHPRVLRAINDQASRLIHVSNMYIRMNKQEELGKVITAKSNMDSVFFCNSGAEANECAIKLARFFGNKKGVSLPKIIVMERAFHGRTLAALSATANKAAQFGFGPLVEGFVRMPFDNIEAIRHAAVQDPDIVAILLEPIQGEGGVRGLSKGYMEAVRKVCDEYRWLLMLDEIQTGYGSNRSLFRVSTFRDRTRSTVTLAKGLASGLPMGAWIVAGQAHGLFGLRNHGSTFGGNPLACAVSLATFSTIDEEGLLARAIEQGERILKGLRNRLSKLTTIVSIRGQGLMIGIEMTREYPRSFATRWM